MINSVLLTSSISTMFPLVAFISVIAVILILFVKVTFNLEVIRQQSSMPTINATVEIPRITMTKVLIPFTISLDHRESDGTVKFSVSSNVKYTLQAFFNVSIREMHLSLSLRSWEEIKESVNVRNEYIIDQAFCKQLALDLRNQNPHEERTITIKAPEEMNLGRAPRLAYPLVIFLIRADSENESADETVLLMNVIHLQDSLCPLPTSILAQYLKQASGQLSCLKQLYLSAIDSDGEYSYSKTNMGSLSLAEPCTSELNSMPILCSDTMMQENSDQLCVVCRYYPLSRALLPCRHTVLCAICFSKLDRCPICRSTITSYFCIRSEDYLGSASTAVQEPKNKSLNWIDAVNDFINDRLTDFLGFR